MPFTYCCFLIVLFSMKNINFYVKLLYLTLYFSFSKQRIEKENKLAVPIRKRFTFLFAFDKSIFCGYPSK